MKRSLAIVCTLALLSFPPTVFAQVGVVSRVSVPNTPDQGVLGTQANGASPGLGGKGAIISADGCIVAFPSAATNLVLGDTNGFVDLFGWICDPDPGEDQTFRVSLGAGGVQPNGESSMGGILGVVGEFVLFISEANNLVAGDNNGVSDVFVLETELFSGITRVSVPNLADQGALGTESNDESDRPSFGDNHRLVVFESIATNLVLNDTNLVQDMFVHDRQTGATTRVSVPNLADQGVLGTEANGTSGRPVISGNGRFVAFLSDATNLVTGDNNGAIDVFVHDRQTGAVTRVSVPNLADQGVLGTEANGPSGFNGPPPSPSPDISADGVFIAFQSDASNLVLNDANGATDIFVHDRTTGETTRVSLPNLADQGMLGTEADASSFGSSISLRGRYVAFASSATNLVTSDTNFVRDIFVHDRQTGATIRANVNGATQADGFSDSPALSADGRFVTFESDATNLVATDTNAVRDIFLAETGFAADPLPFINLGGLVNGASFAPSPAPIAPGSIVSVFGLNLAAGTAFAGATPLPTILADGTISVGFDVPIMFIDAPLFFVSPTQMNIQWPFEVTPTGLLPFATPVLFGLGGQEADLNLATFAPGLFATNQAGTGQGAILISGSGGLVAAPAGMFPGSRPVMAGEFIEIFCTGLGPVTNQPATGAAASASPLSTTTTPPTVTIGGVAATVTFSGLAPGFVGLYQVNVEVPAGAPVGNAIDVVLTIGGVTSNTVTIAVQ